VCVLYTPWMTRRPRIRANRELARPHASGAKVIPVHPVEHSTFGAIHYVWGPLWPEHFRLAKTAAGRLASLHQRVLQIQPGTDRGRYIGDTDLLGDAYEICNAMVSHSVRAVQHLAQDIESQHRQPSRGSTSAERIREAAKLFSLKDYAGTMDYAGFGELVSIRDALEHPSNDTVYQNADWHKVPLAWTLSTRSAETWARFHSWFGRLVQDWEEYKKNRLQTPTTLNILMRGIESTLPLKKPSHLGKNHK
jgi:hypothetical protein